MSDPFRDPIAVALVEVVTECGYEAASVAAVIERAGVTPAEFERRFADKEDCVLQVFEAFIDDFKGKAQSAYDAHQDWRTALRATAYVAAGWIAENPRATRFGTVEVLAAESEMIRVRREELFQWCAGLIDAGRTVAVAPEAIPDSTAVMAIGSIAQMLMKRVQSGRKPEPMRMVPELMYLAVRPYVGEAAAREELTAPPP